MTHPTCARTDTHPPHAEECQGTYSVCFGVPTNRNIDTTSAVACHLHEETE